MIKNRMIKVCTAVPELRIADPAFNAEQMCTVMKDHSDCGLIVFPELSMCGYTCADILQQEALLQACEAGLIKVAKQSTDLPGLTAAVGLPVRVHDHLYNCAAFISEGRICALIPKINIPNYSEFYEQRWFESGRGIHDETVELSNQKVPFGTDILICDSRTGAVIGTDICEDLWVPDKPSTHACLAGANIIVNLSASDETIGKQNYRIQMVSQQSAACWCAYAYASSGADESSTDLVFSGHCMIAENGRILKQSIFPEKNACTAAIIDLDTIRYNRMHQTTWQAEENGYRTIPASVQALDGKIELSASKLSELLNQEQYDISRFPFVPADDAKRRERCAEILRIQTSGLATRVRNTGICNLVIGISGGLDSTLALIAASEAKKLVPEIHIICYTMPNRGNTTDYTKDSALTLMKNLDVEIREVPIEESVKMHLKDIGHPQEYLGDSDTAYENAQARMRTYILMDAANMENGLVVGTGDLSELALGWCTYNGDHMSMYGVNCSIPKTLVKYLVTAYADTCENQQLHDVLHRIAETPITPELTPADNNQIQQKTEDKIGKYDLNDFFLYYTLRYGFAPDKILAFACAAFYELSFEAVKEAEIRFYNRFFRSQFKRSCLPDGPKVGSVTLSPRGDWRMPSDANPALWIEILKNA